MHLDIIHLGETLERKASAATSMIAGLSFSEVRLLKPLLDAPKPGLTRIQLSEFCHLTPSAVSRALGPLEKSGFIATQRDARDARHARTQLREAGRRRLCDALKAVDDTFAEFDFEKTGLNQEMLSHALSQLHRPR